MTTPSNQSATLAEIVAKNRETVSYAFIAIGIGMLLLTLFWGIRWENGRGQGPKAAEDQAQESPPSDDKKKDEPKITDRADYLPAAIWGGLITALFLGSAAFQLSRQPEAGRAVFEARLSVFTLGSLLGLSTALLGFVLAWRWQESVLQWVNKGETQEAKWVLAALAIFLGGLAIMFFSMQLARAEERTNATLRRLLYGSNAIVTGLLLLLLLAVVNVIVYLKLPDNVISTAAAFKGLSDTSKDFLHTVNQPVKTYLIMPENHTIQVQRDDKYNALYADCRALLRACEEENKNFKAVYLSPATDGDEIRNVMKRLKVPETKKEEFGLLIGFGETEDVSEFITLEEVIGRNPEGALAFQGEAKLMTALNFLTGGAKRPVLYFTQSNGELSIAGPTEENSRSCKEIVKYLTERRFEIKPLKLDEGKKPDLADATMIIVAAPTIPFRPEQVEILRQYLIPSGQKAVGGKLVAFLPAFPDASGAVSPTGLESLFLEMGIAIEPKKRLFSLPGQSIPAEWVLGTIASDLRRDRHLLSRPFDQNFQFPCGNIRPIQRARAPQGYVARNIFSSVPGSGVFQDVKYDANPDEIVAQIRKDKADGNQRTATEKQLTNAPIPFAAFVAEITQKDEAVQERPRLVAVGSDWFVNDETLRQPRLNPENYMALTALLVEWTRERPEGMKIEPRALGTFSLPANPDGFNLMVLPVLLIALGIVALGTGVWIARRK